MKRLRSLPIYMALAMPSCLAWSTALDGATFYIISGVHCTFLVFAVDAVVDVVNQRAAHRGQL